MARTPRTSQPLSGQTSTTSTPLPTEATAAIPVGATPPLQGGVPSLPPRRETVQASLLDEYVSAGGYAWYANYPRSLPWAIDDITRDFGDDLYDRMALDGKLAGLVRDFAAALLEDGLRLVPAVKNASDPAYADAQALTAWCQEMLDHLDTPLPSVLWDMVHSALLGGHKVAELVWRYGPDADGATALRLAAIKPKPRHATSFVVDAYYNILGLLALIPGMMTVIQPDLLITQLSDIPNFTPREKFAILTFWMHDSDPRGTSMLRPAYTAWNFKMQVWPEYLKYLVQFASPSLWSTPGPDSETQYEDQYGNALASPITPEQAMVNQLQAMRNGAVASFSPGSTVTAISVGANGEPFIQAIDTCDQQMAAALLGQTLATEEGEHQARSATSAHQDIMDKLIRQAKPLVEAMIQQDILATLVRYNKPDLLPLLPQVSLSAVEESDFAGMAGGVAALENAGYLGESQKPGLDTMLGLPPRDVQADAEAAARALSATVAASAANPAAVPGAHVIEKAAAGPEAAATRAQADSTRQSSPPAGPVPTAGPAAMPTTPAPKGGKAA